MCPKAFGDTKVLLKNLEKGNNSEPEVYLWSVLGSWEKALDVLYVLKIRQESVHKQLRYSLLKLRLGEKITRHDLVARNEYVFRPIGPWNPQLRNQRPW